MKDTNQTTQKAFRCIQLKTIFDTTSDAEKFYKLPPNSVQDSLASKKAIKTSEYPDGLEFTEITLARIPREDSEVFKLIPNTSRYYVSNMGRALKIIYDRQTDIYLERILAGNLSKNKTGKFYVDINIRLMDNKKLRCRLHRAILAAFVDPTFPLYGRGITGRLVGDHIDNNSMNNKLSNLRILSQSDNILSAKNMGKLIGKPSKTCLAYNEETGEIRRYDSTMDLSRDIWDDKNPGRFYAAYRNSSKNRAGWRVFYTDEELEAFKASH